MQKAAALSINALLLDGRDPATWSDHVHNRVIVRKHGQASVCTTTISDCQWNQEIRAKWGLALGFAFDWNMFLS